jgi:aryl-alcohol dehydrogenase-like predicted oxidoreductase
MKYRKLGKTGFHISEISLGTWQVGGKWGSPFNEISAEKIIHTAIDNGVNFIDTADVYDNRLSEKAVGKVVRERSERVYVATKCGRFINPHVSANYTTKILREFVETSLRNTGLDALDLIQLHCPPTEVYGRPEIFGLFERLKEEGKILNLGVSVEKVSEALKAIEYDNVTTVQIIFNMFRHKPAELFFEAASQRDVGIIARVPLASGLLSGTYSEETTFEDNDHRAFNRNGEAFDKGETFSGIDYIKGLMAVAALKHLFPTVQNLAPLALRWILNFGAVSTVIPGASRVDQVHSNLSAYSYPNFSEEQLKAIDKIYSQYIKDSVHHLW